MTAIGVVLDIASLRRRSLARWIMPHELVYTIVYMMVPWDYGDFEIYFTAIYMILNFILMSSKMHVDVILACITLLCVLFGSQPWISTKEMTIVLAVNKIINTIIMTGLLILIATMVTYIAVLKGRLANLVHENIGLLDEMNEGLIVLSKEQLTPVFASKPAIRILKEKSEVTMNNSDVSILQ